MVRGEIKEGREGEGKQGTERRGGDEKVRGWLWPTPASAPGSASEYCPYLGKWTEDGRQLGAGVGSVFVGVGARAGAATCRAASERPVRTGIPAAVI